MHRLVHLLSGAEIQLWMHKRLWPEGKGKHDGIYKNKKCLDNFTLFFSTYLFEVFFYSMGVKLQCGNKMSFHRLERAKKLQEQKEKELFEKQQQQQQEIAAGKSR